MLECWQHKRFADTFQCDDNLELRHLIDGIDMINPFTFIPIALMDRVYANIAGLTVRARFTPLVYGCSFRACLSQDTTLPLISLGDSQVVQVRDRDTRKPLILILAKALIRPLTELFKYRAAGLRMLFTILANRRISTSV